MIDLSSVPDILKHMTLAIFNTRGVRGRGQKGKFSAAFEIARHRLVEYGYLRKGAEKDDAKEFPLTPEGMKREQVHRKEGRRKALQFDALFKKVFKGEKSGDEKGSAQNVNPEDRRKSSEC
jgi:hypothetical protein